MIEDAHLYPVVIVASGPSLSDEQCKLIDNAYLDDRCRVIAVNDSYKRLAPDCIDLVHAADGLWWRTYETTVNKYAIFANYSTADASVACTGLDFVPSKVGQGLAPKGSPYIHRHHSSAHQAVEIAVQRGADHIILVGVDCKADAQGKKHWFGDHPPRFLSPQPFDLWIQDWNAIAKSAQERGIRIVNCSLDTAVECFERSTLEKELFP